MTKIRSRNRTLNHSARRGISLIELMIYLVLFSAFSLIAIPFCRRTLTVMHEAQRATVENARLDSAMDLLRRDVWNAVEIRSLNAATLSLKPSDGHAITWTFDREGTVSRGESSAAIQRWTQMPGGISMTVNDAMVTLSLPDQPHFRGGRITMLSAVSGGSR